MLTRFGKELKKIRVEHDEVLRDMAARLGVTAAYLSAVENDNRKVPDSWVKIIVSEYGLSESEAQNLQEAAYANKDSIKISFNSENDIETNLALSFARKFKEINNADALEIQKILDKIGR